jgi:hypothetical protein
MLRSEVGSVMTWSRNSAFGSGVPTTANQDAFVHSGCARLAKKASLSL